MRAKLSLIFSVFLLPLVLGWGVARAANQQDAGGFRVVLADGSRVNGAVSLVINLDTPYGQIKIPSSSLVSAQFDVQQKWADIQLNDAQLKLRYNPASSDLKAATAVGPLTFALANVIKVAKESAEVSSATSPNAAANRNTAAGQGNVPPPATAPPPTIVYQYPYQYPYVSPAPYYYSPSYYYSPYYWPGPYVGWPYIGIGIGWGRGFGGGGFHGGFRRGR
jgi:hypothetical protein